MLLDAEPIITQFLPINNSTTFLVVFFCVVIEGLFALPVVLWLESRKRRQPIRKER